MPKIKHIKYKSRSIDTWKIILVFWNGCIVGKLLLHWNVRVSYKIRERWRIGRDQFCVKIWAWNVWKIKEVFTCALYFQS